MTKPPHLKCKDGKLYLTISLREFAERYVDEHPFFEAIVRLCDENERLRDLARRAILCSEGDMRCEACPLHEKSDEDSRIRCRAWSVAEELGIEVR